MSREEGPMVVSLPGHPGRGPETLPCLPHLWLLVHHAGLVAPRLAQLFGTLIKFLLCVPDTTPHPTCYLLTLFPNWGITHRLDGETEARGLQSPGPKEASGPLQPPSGGHSVSLTDAYVSLHLPSSAKNHVVSQPRASCSTRSPRVHSQLFECLLNAQRPTPHPLAPCFGTFDPDIPFKVVEPSIEILPWC